MYNYKMSNMVDTPEIEAKELFSQVIEGEKFLFDYFFEVDKQTPDGSSKEDYMKKLREQYFKIRRKEARRLLGLE